MKSNILMLRYGAVFSIIAHWCLPALVLHHRGNSEHSSETPTACGTRTARRHAVGADVAETEYLRTATAPTRGCSPLPRRFHASHPHQRGAWRCWWSWAWACMARCSQLRRRCILSRPARLRIHRCPRHARRASPIVRRRRPSGGTCRPDRPAPRRYASSRTQRGDSGAVCDPPP